MKTSTIKFLIKAVGVNILFMALISCNNSRQKIDTPKDQYNSLIERGENYYDQMAFDKAINCFNKALLIKPTSEIYLHLFSSYMNQNLHEKAEKSLEEALILDSLNAGAYKLKAKYLYFSTEGEKFEITLETFKKAASLGDEESGYYANTMLFLEDLRAAIRKPDYSKWYDLTFPEATQQFYDNRKDFINKTSKIFNDLNSKGGALIDWEYRLPIEFFMEDNSIITKAKTFIIINFNGQSIEQSEDLVLISLDSGKSWYSVSNAKDYYQTLTRYFSKSTLDKIFED